MSSAFKETKVLCCPNTMTPLVPPFLMMKEGALMIHEEDDDR